MTRRAETFNTSTAWLHTKLHLGPLAIVILGFQGGAVVQQQSHHTITPFLCGDVQRCSSWSQRPKKGWGLR